MHFRKILPAACACLALGTALAAAEKRPNIILIMADDMGVENLSCYGSKVYQTPHLDALAASGIRFAHAHSQPICTPSRVQIMTGIHNNRNYVRFGYLDPAEVTFANLLRDAGYATAIGGKWQLGGDYAQVKKFGFDRHCLWQLNRRPSRYPNPGLEIDGERKNFKNGEFGPDVVNGYLRDFIREHRDREQPFFIYYPMMLPHWPFVPTPDHPDWDPAMWRDVESEPGGYRSQKYWDAFVRYTDKMVGRLVATLEETKQRQNTLVIWTADNGTFNGIVSEFNGRPYPGGKGSTKDNGTHVGFIASWPAMIRPGQLSDTLVDFTDLLPTLTAAAAAATPENIDGVSLMPVFQGQPSSKRKKDAIYCWYQRDGLREKASQHARDARHKLYATGRFHDTLNDPAELRDLAQNGVASDLTEIHARLKSLLDRQMAVTRQADPVQKAKRRK